MNRREVLASGFAFSMLAPAAVASHIVSAQHGRQHGLRYFVADGENPHAFAAARAAASKGVAVILAGADVTPLYTALNELWRNAPGAVAGVTTAATAFVLERLALHHNLRIAYRGIHRGRNGSTLTSALLGPPPLHGRIQQAPAGAFAANLGGTLVDSMRSGGERTHGLRALAPPHGGDRAALVSWLFVPTRV